MTAPGPLAGIRVVDLSRVLAGPLCTQTLGDLGADVVKVERPGAGDDTRSWGPPYAGELSAYYLGVNRNKRSVTADLTTEAGREILSRLLASGDVLVENLKLGTLERWGFDDDWFDEHAPGVVRCSIQGYGSTGPKAGRPGYDFILQAETGLMAITGEPDGEAMKLGVAIVDICTGMQATIAVLAGLRARAETGRGQRCEVTLHDTGLHMLANVAANHLVGGAEPRRYGNGHPNIVPYRTYRAGDGELAVSVGNDRQFAVFAGVLGHPEWAGDPRFAANRDRVAHREELDRLVGDAIAERTRAEWIDLLDGAGIPSGPINSVSEALSSAQTAARRMVTEMDHPVAGLVRSLGLPIRMSDTPPSIRLPAPALGADTDPVLAELGYDAAEIEELRASGAV
jgi:succinate---hydroxymethylglutarate CoA-transferase